MTFEDLNLNASLKNALRDMKLTSPTTIQYKIFSVIMSGRDTIGIAQTGTGKTYAYLLPCLRQWKFNKALTPQIMIIVPTRELVVQVVEETEKLTKYMEVSIVGAYGGTNIRTQMNALHQGANIVVGTPGRLMDLMLNGILKTKLIKTLIIDEVDEMLNLGFRTQLKNLMDLLPEKRQNLMFSATLDDEIQKLINLFFKQPERVEAAPAGSPLENINQILYSVPNFNTKINFLKELLADKGLMHKVLVFVSSKKLADELFEKIHETFPEQIGIAHSNKSQNYRFDVVKKFQSGTHRILVATDLISRGLDISKVSHVINFDLPEIQENYIHRIGRTGRAQRKGNAISLFCPYETHKKLAIERFMGFEIPSEVLPDHVEISTVLTLDEFPKTSQPNLELKNPLEAPSGEAFHEKKSKNQKINAKVRYLDKMKRKYKNPKKRRSKHNPIIPRKNGK
ncbi:MAG: DEAD/DEAH box helicase [Flammeovirgaceae bacterium]|nr:DEAD/DEAH box helicase [Flammeovirgaceae bacterium]|tara:strand:+ start:233 stop:1591 length:1359 start_codon:yes stop_codon:yes gene_type:complete